MRKKILAMLKRNEDIFISGEKISYELGISRSAVWKHINILREEGYEIESMPKNGYKLLSCPDILTLEEIKEYLTTDFIGRKVYYLDTLTSTNMKAKEMAFNEEEGTIIIAEEQTKGKGRLGRNWVSPKGKGIWMSIILKPEMAPSEVAKLTLIGAAAVNKGLEEIGIGSCIKWPNDILIQDKKVCGILTEMSCELNMINYVIMGIGINVNLDSEDFNRKLIDKATSLKIITGSKIDRKRLTAKILNHFEDLYIPFKERGDISKTIHISRENSILIGREIRIIREDTEYIGQALDIDDEGQLIVKYKDGKVEEVFSGEVSIRGLKGYI
ncbi:Bifunctional protein BirA (Includes: Biotin operon repressor; Biotin--(acetyl-CoA-carboxylase) synthetase) [[Clostridium] ultunense Esp]|uniref:Bifunctional ligase/repressor BirA n=1 Tax=[Clostridium] ultunense Esp TaxID=1288971 RepID=M1ZFE7_9FIRM|nr:biotin--[acetyl-CoA-carboxylase] ligase [Schnuerera ultunensis]CCQ97064.1 Bifunctional protein BirA (Includes: Biotin operon repressor; Biotin--(acetyl-CoA-carboxylase) synthetase) [[Clostridium] ultunense Esp]SHD78294.1 Bifunctional ligase/repressor BirA [[Clostridium] ultunense Esp]